MVEERELLFGIAESSFQGQRDQRVLLRPLYRLNPLDKQWIPIEQVERAFPSQGYITWINKNDPVEKGSIRVFGCEEWDRFDVTDKKHDKYRIDWDNPPESPYEVLELFSGKDGGLPLEIERGFELSFIPTRPVILRIDREHWFGPVVLDRKDDQRWYIRQREK